MPESCKDRPTTSHEYVLMLTKSARYYWDADTVREPQTSFHSGDRIGGKKYNQSPFFTNPEVGRNIRSVWTISTQPYPESHFATFPEKLVTICIKAGSSEYGCCSKCGAPWERIVERKQYPRHDTEYADLATDGDGANRGKHATPTEIKTLGWQPTCDCKGATKISCLVLDPFGGSGTTAYVAKKLNRRCVLYELSEEYCELAARRNKQQRLVF